MLKIKNLSPPKIISDRSIILNQKSREKSSSGDDKKSNSSLKKRLYKHVIFDKQRSPPKFKTLQRIRQQAFQQEDIKWRSNEELSLNGKIKVIFEDQASQNNEINKKIKSDEVPEIQTKEYLKLEKIHQFKSQQDRKTVKHTGKKTEVLQSKRPQQIIVAHFIPTENRDQQILRRKLETNLKFLTSQTSQILSFTKFMLLEAQTQEKKKKMSEISIQLREMRIRMRNHEYTKQINFTFPVKKHNDDIKVKMPESVSEKQMFRFHVIEQKIKAQNELSQRQSQKLKSLTQYYMSLLKKQDPISEQKIDIISNDNLAQQNVISEKYQNSESNKIKKVKSFDRIPKNTNLMKESFCTVNSKSSNKIHSLAIVSSPMIKSQKSLMQQKYQTLKLKKQALIENIQKLNVTNQAKTKRVAEQIQMLKNQLYFLNQNLERTIKSKAEVVQQIQYLTKKKIRIAHQNRQNSQKYLRSIENMTAQRKQNYLKERNKRNIQDKGFSFNLRQNKSLSPQSYLSNTSRNFLASFSPKFKK